MQMQIVLYPSIEFHYLETSSYELQLKAALPMFLQRKGQRTSDHGGTSGSVEPNPGPMHTYLAQLLDTRRVA